MSHHRVGRDSPFYMLPQLVSGVPALGAFQRLDHYGLTPRRNDPMIDDPLIGAGLNNPIDAQAPADGLIEASLDVIAPLCFNQIGMFLPHLFRSESVTGAGPYTHIFTSGQRELSGASCVWPEGNGWQRANTWAIERMELSVQPETGRRQISFSGPASDIERVMSDPLGGALAPLIRQYMPAGPGAVVRYAGTVIANLVGGRVSYARTLAPFRPAGRADRTVQEFTPDVGASFTGTLDLRVKSTTFYDLAQDKTAHPFEIEYRVSDGARMTLACPSLRFEPTEQPITGPGLRTETYSIRGEQTEVAPMLTLTLTNAISGYPEPA